MGGKERDQRYEDHVREKRGEECTRGWRTGWVFASCLVIPPLRLIPHCSGIPGSFLNIPSGPLQTLTHRSKQTQCPHTRTRGYLGIRS